MCIFMKLREKLRKKRESRAKARNIEMVILDSPEEMPQSATLNKSTWKVIKSWVKQKSFRYEEDYDESPGFSLKINYFDLN